MNKDCYYLYSAVGGISDIQRHPVQHVVGAHARLKHPMLKQVIILQDGKFCTIYTKFKPKSLSSKDFQPMSL